MKEEIVKQRVLTADAGMYLTNGEVVATTVVLPVDADDSAWREIPEAEAQTMLSPEEESADV